VFPWVPGFLEVSLEATSTLWYDLLWKFPYSTQKFIIQVTLCMAIFRDFPWRKVPGYVLGQLVGAWAGAILVFGNYFHAIDIVEGKGKRSLKTGSLFATYAVCLA
jgi:Major intrinsic protein